MSGPRTTHGNLPVLRDRWLIAERAWRDAVAAAGLDLYSDDAEGKMIGRGKSAAPDALRKLFNARTEARDLYNAGVIDRAGVAS